MKARDLLKVIKQDEAREDPKPTCLQQLKNIKANISGLDAAYNAMEKKYFDQLKNDPTSWAGIGRGGDLEYIEQQSKELVDAFKNHAS